MRTDLGMYEGKTFNGKTLLEWREHFHNEYSLGEIYRMAIDGKLSAHNERLTMHGHD